MVKYITRRFIGEYDPYYGLSFERYLPKINRAQNLLLFDFLEGCWTKYENVDGVDLVVQIYDTYDKVSYSSFDSKIVFDKKLIK
jgi:hypothetical protein